MQAPVIFANGVAKALSDIMWNHCRMVVGNADGFPWLRPVQRHPQGKPPGV